MDICASIAGKSPLEDDAGISDSLGRKPPVLADDDDDDDDGASALFKGASRAPGPFMITMPTPVLFATSSAAKSLPIYDGE